MRVLLRKSGFLLAGLACLACSVPFPDSILKPGSSPFNATVITIVGVPAVLTVGETRQLAAAVLDADNNAIPNPSVTWSTSDTRIATVSVTGLVAAVAIGTVTVRASSGGVSREATFAVSGATPGTPVSPSPPTTPDPGTSAAQGPRVYLNTAMPATTGRSIVVNAGGSLQAALDDAVPGDEVVLQAGATFVGNFTLRPKAGASTVPGTGKVITVRTSALSSLPENRRVGPGDAPYMAKLATALNYAEPLATQPAAAGWRLVGLEITAAPSVANQYQLVRIGDGSSTQNTLASVPSNIIIDRSYVHGTRTLDVRRCIDLQSASSAVVDSYLSDCHAAGADAQAIGGWNGPGPYKINNNYLEASGENVMFGGAPVSVPGLVPSDIEVRGNYLFKPLSWKKDDPSYAGLDWSIKNHFEVKLAQHVLFEGNVLENCWVAAQDGWSIILKSDAETVSSTDIILKSNIIRGAANGIDLGGGVSVLSRIDVANNLLLDIGSPAWAPAGGGGGRLFQILHVENAVLTHNTAFGTAYAVSFDGLPSPGFVFTDNVTTLGTSGVKGSGLAPGVSSLAFYAPGYRFAGNGFIGTETYTPENFMTSSVGMASFAADYSLNPDSPFKRRALDGTDPGIDAVALAKASGSVKP